MGTWGTGIYSNDISEDLRYSCSEIFSYYDVDTGNSIIFKEYEELLNQGVIDNEYASFWYALADWQWRHGMLTQNIKDTAIELLSAHTGIDEWMESGETRDVKKRIKVLDELKARLESPMPPLKKPILKLHKPKHKPGDIVIFQVTDDRDECGFWRVDRIRPPICYRSPEIANSPTERINGYNAHGKYMAILCVGSMQKIYSQHIPDLYDEYSVYAWYNYMSDVEPSVETLSRCGFLPMIIIKAKNIFEKSECVEWAYKFTICNETFRNNNDTRFNRKVNCKNEFDRFQKLYKDKNYSDEVITTARLYLYQMFSYAFEETNRLEILGLKADDLLDPDIRNPDLLSPAEYDAVSRKMFS